MLTSVMVNNSLIGKSAIRLAGKAGACEASEASRAGTSRRREIGRVQVSVNSVANFPSCRSLSAGLSIVALAKMEALAKADVLVATKISVNLGNYG